jgi:hypothetical protein
LDDEANYVDERALIDELQTVPDFERGLQRLNIESFPE